MDVRNHIAIRIGVGRWSLRGVLWVDVGDVRNGRELRHEEKACNDSQGREQGCLASTHGITFGKAYASLCPSLFKDCL